MTEPLNGTVNWFLIALAAMVLVAIILLWPL